MNIGKRQMTLAAGLVAVASAALLAGCGEREGASAGGGAGELRVVVSIFPLGSLVEQAVGEAGGVTVLLPAGASPHGFEVTASQVRTLAEADLLVRVGQGLDPWAERAAQRVNPDIDILRMAEMVGASQNHEAAHHDHHGHEHHHASHHDAPLTANPHHWLDPERTAMCLEALRPHLAEHAPEHNARIQAHIDALLEEVHAVDAAYREALKDVKRRELITFHNAFDLLAARYDLNVVAHLTPIELTPGGEITPDRLKRAVRAIEAHALPVVYAEPQFPDSAVAALREQTGVNVLRLDPIGDPRREGYASWQKMMRSNLQTLVDGQNR